MNKMFEKCKKVSFAKEAETVDQWLTEARLVELLIELGFEENNQTVVKSRSKRSGILDFDDLSLEGSSYFVCKQSEAA